MHPRSLPQLSKQLRDQNHKQKPQTNEAQNFENKSNIFRCDFVFKPPDAYSKTVNNRTGGLITSTGVVLVVLVLVFVVPVVVLVVIEVVASHDCYYD